uniref:Uncharacterized protein n=1 Tax=Megaselia scalaris TaxID=36166 RepID=T1GG26_MEGSC
MKTYHHQSAGFVGIPAELLKAASKNFIDGFHQLLGPFLEYTKINTIHKRKKPFPFPQPTPLGNPFYKQ